MHLFYVRYRIAILLNAYFWQYYLGKNNEYSKVQKKKLQAFRGKGWNSQIKGYNAQRYTDKVNIAGLKTPEVGHSFANILDKNHVSCFKGVVW